MLTNERHGTRLIQSKEIVQRVVLVFGNTVRFEVRTFLDFERCISTPFSSFS